MDEGRPIFGAISRTGGPPSRLRRARWLGFLIAMLAFNAYPISDFVHRSLATSTAVLVLLAEGALALVWVRTMWLALATVRPFRVAAPWLASVAVLAVGLSLGMGGQYNGLLIYLSIACAVTLPLRWVWPGVVGTTLIGALAVTQNVRYLGPSNDRLNEIVAGLSLVFFLALMMWFYRRMMMLIIELRQARGELARLAVTEERLRFARDLHDLLGHSLSSISLKGQLAARLLDQRPLAPERVAEQVNDIQAVAQEALSEVRQAVSGYRRRALGDELDAIRATLTDAGIKVDVHVSGTPLPDELDTLLAWVVREGGTNVLRHSMAQRCAFQLRRVDGLVCLDIDDDGIGATNGIVGNGLTGLAERVSAAGGTLDSGSAPGRGFRLHARLPLPATSADDMVAR